MFRVGQPSFMENIIFPYFESCLGIPATCIQDVSKTTSSRYTAGDLVLAVHAQLAIVLPPIGLLVYVRFLLIEPLKLVLMLPIFSLPPPRVQ